MMPKNDTSVVVVTFNNAHSINGCIESILKSDPGVEIVIVDNASTDDTLIRLNKFKNQLKIIKCKGNVGFARGCNLGVRDSSGQYLIFLNPDSEVIVPHSLSRLVKSLIRHPQFGLIGPRIIFPDGQVQPTVRNMPTLTRAIKEYILGIKGSYDFFTPNCHSICEVETVVGACMVIKRSLFNSIGGFSEKFFLYYEDIELCQRLRMRGFKIGFHPNVVLKHKLGESGGAGRTSKLLVSSAKKYHGLIYFYLLQLIFYLSRLTR